MDNQNLYNESSAFKNSRRGFMLMLGGPAVLILGGLLYQVIGDFPDILAFIFGGIAFILPGIGLVFAIKSLLKRKELYKFDLSVSIITCVMCNPIFYFFYFFICFISGSALAGMSMM
jgi:hypothetical protein